MCFLSGSRLNKVSGFILFFVWLEASIESVHPIFLLFSPAQVADKAG